MIGAIKQFMDTYITPAGKTVEGPSQHTLHLATAALLIEMMHMDDEVKPEEREEISKSIQCKFELTDEETTTLIDLAGKEAAQATDYYQFTSLINKGFSAEQKLKVIDNLWQVAFADNHLDPHEEHMVRKIAELLYVPHRDFIASKHKAELLIQKNGG